jgi:hypothetical protein
MCTVDWGLVINAITAAGAFFAGIVALFIATCDRKERKRERRNAAKAQAKLVLSEVTVRESGFSVEARNYGSSAVLDVELYSAEFLSAGGSTLRPAERPLSYAVLDSDRDRNGGTFFIEFIDHAGQNVLAGKSNADPEQVLVAIRFTDSQGNHWERSGDSVKLLRGRA